MKKKKCEKYMTICKYFKWWKIITEIDKPLHVGQMILNVNNIWVLSWLE